MEPPRHSATGASEGKEGREEGTPDGVLDAEPDAHVRAVLLPEPVGGQGVKVARVGEVQRLHTRFTFCSSMEAGQRAEGVTLRYMWVM